MGRIGMGLGLGSGGITALMALDGKLRGLNVTEFWLPEMGIDSAAAVGTWTGRKVGATLTQATSFKKPVRTAGILGGRAALVGNGSTTGGISDGKRLDNSSIAFGTSFTITVVAAWVDPGAEIMNTRLLDWQVGSPGANRLVGKYGTNTWQCYNGGFFGSTAANSGTAVVLTYKQTNGVGGRLYINGTSVGNNALDVVATTGFSVLGPSTVSNEYHEGYLGPVVVNQSSALSDDDRLAIERAVGAYHGVTIA